MSNDIEVPEFENEPEDEETRSRHRRDDYDSSKEGAKAVKRWAAGHKNRLLIQFDVNPDGLNDEEAAEKAGLLDACYWKRCGELRKLGFIEYPEDEPMRKGRKRISRMISTITPSGHQAVRHPHQD
jgi:hypothetical protein